MRRAGKIVAVFFALALFFVFDSAAQSQQSMSSENYIIYADVVSAGGASSTSANYIVTDTLSEFGASTTASSNYENRGGFWNVVPYGTMSAVMSKSAISLGSMKPEQTNSDSQIISVTSTVATGYSMQITEDGNLRTAAGADINDVADGGVTAGSEEYGINTSGTDGLYNAADTAITNGYKTIAARAAPANGEAVTVTYKASVSPDSPDGAYSQTVTIYVTANL